MEINNISDQYEIKNIRFFVANPGSTMVALYGEPSCYSDGWIANFSIDEVFTTPPNEFVLDRLYCITDISFDAKLSWDSQPSPATTTTTTTTTRAISDQQFTVEIGGAIDHSDPSNQPLAFFPHIPKTGGQTLLDGFFRVFSRKKCLKIWNPRVGADVAPKSYAQVGKPRLDKAAAVVGHLSMAQFNRNQYCHSLLENNRVRIFSSVREPIDRIISLYNYIKLSPRHRKHSNTMSMSLFEFAMEIPANFQFHFLALHPSESIDSIQSRIEVYPIENSRQGLEIYFARHFDAKISCLDIRNASQELAKSKGFTLASINDLSHDAVRHLKAAHHLDTELYNTSCQSTRTA